jgi:predicted DNA-binding transcriptional regulator AlpA
MNIPKLQLHSSVARQLSNRNRMLDVRELMEILPYTRATLCGWCREGKVPHARMPDNSYLFDPGKILAWLNERSL